MYTGTRLTQLSHGEPLLGTVWSYNNLTGVQAAEQRLQDLFLNAKNLGFNSIIDTIRPQLDQFGNLTLENNGFYGNLWPLERRLELYRQFSVQFGISLLIEIEMPTNITDVNIENYSTYIISLINQYNWILNWQILVTPEIKDNLNNVKCSPKNYVVLLKNIYTSVKLLNSNISIGGPGIYQALIDFNNSIAHSWLLEATGYYYDPNDPIYNAIGPYGFLPYVDFFSIQGKQNTAGLSYEIFPSIIDKLNTFIKSKISKTLPIYSIFQGWQADASNSQSLQEQGYYELREILNCIEKSVVPFKYQLVDEYDNGNIDLLNYGLFYYYLGSNGNKPAVDQYQFLLQALKDFNVVTTDLEVIDSNPNIQTLTLLNKLGTQSATVIWTKTIDDETIVLEPHYNRSYLLPDGTTGLINNPITITLDVYKFIIVFQNINKQTINTAEIEALVEKKLNHTEETLINLINLLPGSYNKEIKDINYYKLLRAFALEMADVKIEIENNFDNFYLNTAHEESIYNNFGVLVKLGKKPQWSYEKYRSLVKGIIKSLLTGPTPQSIIDALELFTNFNVNIYELYKNPIGVDPSISQTVNPQFAFVVEIEKPIDAFVNQDELFEDVNYVINIIKPAHTLQLIIVSLSGKENYRDQYRAKYDVNFINSDVIEIDTEVNNKEGIYGYKCINYNGQFITNNSLTNGGLFIGPRYVLYDETQMSVEVNPIENFNFNEVEDTFYSLIQRYNTEIIEPPTDDSYLELDETLRECKFGINFNGSILQTGSWETVWDPSSPKFNPTYLGGNGTNSNNWSGNKLAPSYKLSDLYSMDLSMFLQDKYIFRNTLNTLRFNNPSNIPFNGFNSKFAPNIPDKMIEIDVDLNEIVNLDLNDELKSLETGFSDNYDTGEIIDISEAGTYYYDLSHFGHFYGFILGGDNINTSGFNMFNNELYIIPDEGFNASLLTQNTLYLKSNDYTDMEYEINELYEKPTENLETTNIELDEYEFLRSRLLGPNILHIHKVVISNIENNLKVFLPATDLADKSTLNNPSPIRVFVNGLLQSSDVYEELISPLNNDKINGIEFYSGTVKNNDTVNILYIKTQEVIIGDFPWNDVSDIGWYDPNDAYATPCKEDYINKPITDIVVPDWGKYYYDLYNLPIIDIVNHVDIDMNNVENYIPQSDIINIGWYDPNDAYATPCKEDYINKPITDTVVPDWEKYYYDLYNLPIIDIINHVDIDMNNVENYIPQSDNYNNLLNSKNEDIINMNSIIDTLDEIYFEQYHELIELINNPTESIEINNDYNNVENYIISEPELENIVNNQETRILQNNFSTALKFNFIFNHGTFPSSNILDVNDYENELREQIIQVVDVIKDFNIISENIEVIKDINEELNIHNEEIYLEEYDNAQDILMGKNYSDWLTEYYNVKQTQLNMELYKIHNGNKTIIKTM